MFKICNLELKACKIMYEVCSNHESGVDLLDCGCLQVCSCHVLAKSVPRPERKLLHIVDVVIQYGSATHHSSKTVPADAWIIPHKQRVGAV